MPGRLSAVWWADYVGASAISDADDDREGPLTIVTLHSVDQSALIGLINALFAAGVPLLSVRRVFTAGQVEAA